MHNNPLISVIVPVYKVEQYIHNCVNSVIGQSYTNWELILVDDGSPDTCPQLCDEYSARDKRISVIHKKNGGLSSARNAALDIIKGEYVTFLDSDDFWQEDYLNDLLELATKYSADIVQCGFLRGNEKCFPLTYNSKIKINIYNGRSILKSSDARIIMWGKLYKYKLFEGIRMPVGKINEDDFTTWKLYFRASKIVVSNKAYYYYTYNENSIMGIQKTKPRLDFIEAYAERISCFANESDSEMETISRLQFCKSLFLTLRNANLEEEQLDQIKMLFDENWKKIKNKNLVPFKFRSIFTMYSLMPSLSLWVVGHLYKN